jgi:hypothetical protein
MTVRVVEQYDFDLLANRVKELQEQLAKLRRTLDEVIDKQRKDETCRAG